jgi:D-inositol-3-phosphate glycosyltransferase
MTVEMARLKDMSTKLGLDESVLFLGRRNQDNLPYYYSAADVLVMPSHYESFGMVALEAMACGTPVIASEVGGLAYLVRDGETGFTIPVEEPDTLCEKLSWLLNDDKLHTRMSRKAMEYAGDYAWEKIASQIVGEYKKLL